MAHSLQARAEDLFCHFMAPLVLGGELRPGRIVGAKKALVIGVERTITDVDLWAHVELARVRIARKIAPIDRVAPPTPHEWALAACLHDIVQSTHPAIAGFFRGDAAARALDLVGRALDRIPPPRDAAEALSRHTWFSRALEISRTDTRVSWWIGSDTFRGSEPPARLTSWPELRRVRVDRSIQNITTLAGLDRMPAFHDVLARWLTKSPLTDLAAADRDMPVFTWSEPTLALVASHVGRTLAARTLRFHASPAALGPLTRATAQLAAVNAELGAMAQTLIDEARFFEHEGSPHADGQM